MSGERVGANQRQGVGVQGQRVLVAIGAGGAMTLTEVCMALTGQVARQNVAGALGDLERRGFLSQLRKRGVPAWSLTAFGVSTLPKPIPERPEHFRELERAATPPRRLGADDHKAFPSVAGEQRIAWRHPA